MTKYIVIARSVDSPVISARGRDEETVTWGSVRWRLPLSKRCVTCTNSRTRRLKILEGE